jgi:hypothetical protein
VTSATLPRASIEELCAKYAAMLEMRTQHHTGEEVADEVRPRMAALAARFPGALREIDDLELREIRRRAEMLGAVLRREAEVEPWMRAMARFHALARGALCAKRWLAGRKRVDSAVVRAYAAAAPAMAFASDAEEWADPRELARVASPPGGRVTSVVFARVARELGVSEREAKRLVFGDPGRAR